MAFIAKKHCVRLNIASRWMTGDVKRDSQIIRLYNNQRYEKKTVCELYSTTSLRKKTKLLKGGRDIIATNLRVYAKRHVLYIASVMTILFANTMEDRRYQLPLLNRRSSDISWRIGLLTQRLLRHALRGEHISPDVRWNRDAKCAGRRIICAAKSSVPVRALANSYLRV